MEYFVLKGHDTTGPFSEEDLRRAFAGQRLGATDLVRPGDERYWTPLRKLLDRLDGIDTPSSTEAVAPVAPPEPDLAAVLATMAPHRGFAEVLATIGADPLRTGLAGIGLAALLAFLSRWPLLVALPGLLLGVTAGLMLIMRNRPLLGGIISLAAILLPIALAPKPSVPASEFREAVEPQPVPGNPEQPSAFDESRPVLDPSVEISSFPAEVPRPGEPPAPVPAAIPALPPFVEKPDPRAAATPPSTPAKTSRPDAVAPPRKNLELPPVRPSPIATPPPLIPPKPAARSEPLPKFVAVGASEIPTGSSLPSIGLSVQATTTGGKVTSRNGVNPIEQWDYANNRRVYGEDYWSTRDRESRVGIDIDVHNFSRVPATVRVQSLFFAKGVSGGSPVLLNSTVQDLTIPAGDHQGLNASSATVTNSTDRTFSKGTNPDPNGYSPLVWSAANVTGGAKVYGWIVQVLAGDKSVAMRASTPTLEQIARNPDALAKITAEMPPLKLAR